MAAIDRLLRANRQIMLVPVIDGATEPLLVSPTGVTCPFSAPTTAVLAAWAAVVLTSQTGATHGGNVSCALLDDVKLGLAASDTDTELTICSIGNEVTPTFYKVDADLTGLRDASQSDTGVFNLWTQLVNDPDTRYVIVDRIGSPSGTVEIVGDIVSMYEVYTDNPVDVKADKGNLKLQQTPNPTGLVNLNYTLLT